MANKVEGQYKCECGHIAEIRRKSKGQKLLYKTCVCGVSHGTPEMREKWLNELGTFGAFKAKHSPNPENTTTGAVSPASKEWQPSPELIPENCEPEAEATPEPTREKPETTKNNGWLLKSLALAAVAGLALAGINIKTQQQ